MKTRTFGMKRGDEGQIATVKGLRGWRFERSPFVRASYWWNNRCTLSSFLTVWVMVNKVVYSFSVQGSICSSPNPNQSNRLFGGSAMFVILTWLDSTLKHKLTRPYCRCDLYKTPRLSSQGNIMSQNVEQTSGLPNVLTERNHIFKKLKAR